jgi:hypothetical protein
VATKLVFNSDIGSGLEVNPVTIKVGVKVDGTTIGTNGSGQLVGLGGGGETFVASGALPNGAVVALRSDGKVELVVATPGQQLGSEVVFNGGYADFTSTTFDSANGKVVIAYQDTTNSNAGTAIVGTVSGNSISFGSEVVFNVGSQVSNIGATFDSANGKVVIAYRDVSNSNSGTAIVGTVSGNSISFGSEVVFSAGYTDNISTTFDSANGKVVIAYRNSASSFVGTAIVGTVSGNSISFGSGVVFSVGGQAQEFGTTFDSTNGKVVIAYRQNSTGASVVVGTVSGNSISFGSGVVFSTTTQYNFATFDSTNNRVVIVCRNSVTDSLNAFVGTVSGNSISVGSAVDLFSPTDTYIGVTFDSTNSKVVVICQGFIKVGTVTGNSITFGGGIPSNGGSYSNTNCATFDPTNGRVVIVYNDNSNSFKTTANVFNTNPPVTTNANDWVGIVRSAATDTEPVALFLDGETASNLSGLTPSAQYYVADNGTLTTTTNSRYIGRALSATKLRIIGSGKL